ncbi:MAG: energy transducer TonB [Deltaproteobacteria bacterium]|nr:MAG: energy transducer TonB [Deltaproteobacteria bacterium]
MVHSSAVTKSAPMKLLGWLSIWVTHKWAGATLLAVGAHLAVWFLPVKMPANEPKKPREIRILIKKVQPPPRPEVQPKRQVVPPPPRRRKVRRRKKRRVRRPRRKRRRVVKKPRPIPKPVPQPKPRREVPPPPRPVIPPRAVAKASPQPAPRRRVVPQPVPRQAPARRVNLRPYGRALYRSIMRHKRYPRMAVRMGYEGKVLLLIRVTPRGKLLGEPRILRSSGYAMLDKEAVRMIKAAAPWPAMPTGFSRPYKSFRLPVRFRLRR